MRSRFLLVSVLMLLVVPNVYASKNEGESAGVLGEITYASYALVDLWDFVWAAARQTVDGLQNTWEELGPTIVPTGQPEEELGPTIVPTGEESGPTIVPVG